MVDTRVNKDVMVQIKHRKCIFSSKCVFLLYVNHDVMLSENERTVLVGLTLAAASVSQLRTRVVVLLQRLLEVENSQVMFPHCKVNAAQIVPEHTSNTFT